MSRFSGSGGGGGKSAYETWLEQGNTGTEQDFLNSLKGTASVAIDDAITNTTQTWSSQKINNRFPLQGKKVQMVAGVIRNDGTGWKFIQDTGHEPLNGVSVTHDTSMITVNFPTGYKVISFVTNMDETYTRQGYICGASVTTSSAKIQARKVYPEKITSVIRNISGTWSSTNASVGVSWDSTNKKLDITHPVLDGEVIIQNNQGSLTPVISSSALTTSSLSIEFFRQPRVYGEVSWDGSAWVHTNSSGITALTAYGAAGVLVDMNSCDGPFTITPMSNHVFKVPANAITNPTRTQVDVVNLSGTADKTGAKFAYQRMAQKPVKDTPASNEVGFYFHRYGNFKVESVDPNTLTDSMGNIWFIGLIEMT